MASKDLVNLVIEAITYRYRIHSKFENKHFCFKTL